MTFAAKRDEECQLAGIQEVASFALATGKQKKFEMILRSQQNRTLAAFIIGYFDRAWTGPAMLCGSDYTHLRYKGHFFA